MREKTPSDNIKDSADPDEFEKPGTLDPLVNGMFEDSTNIKLNQLRYSGEKNDI